jgi:uncharacterized membrane protein (DUF2068 family)
MHEPLRHPPTPRKLTAQRSAVRVIAAIELLKGLAALASGVGFLSLLHHDLHHLALELVGHFGLDPAQHYPALLLHYADVLNGTPVKTVILFGSGYAAIRLVEAYGLWYERPWGEVLGALSGGIYIPFELRHLYHRPSIINGAVLALNIAIVAFLVLQLKSQRATSRQGRAGSSR